MRLNHVYLFFYCFYVLFFFGGIDFLQKEQTDNLHKSICLVLQLHNVAVELLDRRGPNADTHESLASLNFIRCRLLFDVYSDRSKDVELVSHEIVISDTRFKGRSTLLLCMFLYFLSLFQWKCLAFIEFYLWSLLRICHELWMTRIDLCYSEEEWLWRLNIRCS